jgi:predicted kinase
MEGKKTLILTVGLPRSGKSTWAREQGLPVVNPDSIRLALHGEAYLERAEPMVWVIAKIMVTALFEAGHAEVILDATSVTQERRDFWKNNLWSIQYEIFDTSVEECIRRAKISEKLYLIPVIERMAAEMSMPEGDEK